MLEMLLAPWSHEAQAIVLESDLVRADRQARGSVDGFNRTEAKRARRSKRERRDGGIWPQVYVSVSHL